MGQLINKKRQLQFLLPIIVGVLVFIFVRPVFANMIAGDVRLEDQLSLGTNTVETLIESREGHTVVGYQFDGKKTFISQKGVNARMPFIRGEYLVYLQETNGMGQIFRYHLPTQATLQITNFGNNTEPRVNSKGQVVWKEWREEQWNVGFFDGQKVSHLTHDESVQSPDISDDAIVYAKRTSSGSWQTQHISLQDNRITTVATGMTAKFPRFVGMELTFFSPGKKRIAKVRPSLNTQPFTHSNNSSSTETTEPVDQTQLETELTPELSEVPTISTTPTSSSSSAPSPTLSTTFSPTPTPTPTPAEITLEEINQELLSDLNSLPPLRKDSP